MTTTGFYYDERCFWFGGGNYALTVPVGGLTQPLSPMYLILSYHLRMQKSLEGKITVKKPKPYLK